MRFTVPVALFGWPLVILALFSVLRPRHAVMSAFILAWLFLPLAGYSFPGMPNYTKMTATAYGAILGVLLFDPQRLMSLRPTLADLPMVVWCIVPMASSVSNNLGVYDGLSAAFGQTMAWGVPYLMGRLYLSDLDGLRELAIGMFIGGLIYVPLCLLEIRLSPRLHIWVYGYHQHNWGQSHRFGGWRPTVFMQHGLMVAMWMVLTTLIGYWLWRTRALLSILGVPMSWLVGLMGVTSILCKSAGAVILGLIGVGALTSVRILGIKWGLVALVLAPILYMGGRSTGVLEAPFLLDTVESLPVLTESHVGSFRYRIEAEEILAEHALRRPVLGWGGWSRNRPAEMGEEVDEVATDGLWVITLGTRGIIGLVAMTAVILLPAALFLWKMPVSAWWRPGTSPAAVLAAVLVLFMIDSLLNAMYIPIYMLAAGGLNSCLMRTRLILQNECYAAIGVRSHAQTVQPTLMLSSQHS